MARRVLLSLGLALSALTLSAVPARAAAPESFDLSAVAVVARVSSTQQPAASVITAGLVDVTAGFATSALRDGGSAESLASALYPGDLVSNGPNLLCQELFPCPVAPPGYPLLADAAYPTQPESSATMGPVSARASASAVRTEARADGAALPAAAPVTWATAMSTTRAWVSEGTAHVLAHSALQDVAIGPVRIAALDSTDLVDLPVGRQPVSHPLVTVAGVTVNGQAATLDQKGLHVAGQDVDVTEQELAQQGIAVRLLGQSSTQGVGSARVFAGALEVVLTRPVSGAPSVPGLPGLDRVYVTTVLLGGTGIAGAASDSGSLALPPVVSGPPSAVALLPPVSQRQLVTPPVAARVEAPRASGGPRPLLMRPVALVERFDLSDVALALLVLPTSLLLLWRGRVELRARGL